jgi:hypothetical protein
MIRNSGMTDNNRTSSNTGRPDWLSCKYIEYNNGNILATSIGKADLICSLNEGTVRKFEDLFLFAMHFLFLHKLIWCEGEKRI